MITLLASIAGFLGSVFPEIIKYFIDNKDKKHELEILKYQLKNNSFTSNEKQQEIGSYYDMAESKALYATYKTGINWIDALNGTVRPVLAYSFFAIYCGVKWLQFELISSYFHKITLVEEKLLLLWSVEDQAIFAGIISFYYGHRAINKLLNNRIK